MIFSDRQLSLGDCCLFIIYPVQHFLPRSIIHYLSFVQFVQRSVLRVPCLTSVEGLSSFRVTGFNIDLVHRLAISIRRISLFLLYSVVKLLGASISVCDLTSILGINFNFRLSLYDPRGNNNF